MARDKRDILPVVPARSIGELDGLSVMSSSLYLQIQSDRLVSSLTVRDFLIFCERLGVLHTSEYKYF